MIKNMSATDRLLRLAFAVVVLVLYFTNVISGTLALILLIVAAIFTLTSLVNYCPIYQIIGLNRWVKKSD